MIHIYQGFCPDELQPGSRDPKCPACQVEADHQQLRAEVTRLTAELERLTTGGSEFHNSPDNCLQWIRERLENRGKIAKERNQLRAELERLTTDLNWIHGAASWLKNNNVNPRAWQCIQDIIDRAEGPVASD